MARLDGDEWKAPAGHGLECSVDEPQEGAELDLSCVRISRTGDSLIERTAFALDSPILAEEATLSELIASLDTELYFEQSAVNAPQPVVVASDWSGAQGPLNETHVQRLIIGPVPDVFSEHREVVPASPKNLEYERIVDPSPDDFSAWLATFPTLKKLGTPTRVTIEPSLRTLGEGTREYDAHVEWGDGTAEIGEDQLEWTRRSIDVVDRGASQEAASVVGVVFPRVGANTAALHPLVNWWLILYSLSVLARYHPRVWSGVLDIDQSRLAIPMRHLLNEAASSTQRLVAQTLAEAFDD